MKRSSIGSRGSSTLVLIANMVQNGNGTRLHDSCRLSKCHLAYLMSEQSNQINLNSDRGAQLPDPILVVAVRLKGRRYDSFSSGKHLDCWLCRKRFEHSVRSSKWDPARCSSFLIALGMQFHHNVGQSRRLTVQVLQGVEERSNVHSTILDHEYCNCSGRDQIRAEISTTWAVAELYLVRCPMCPWRR